jgi:hypothetical protein
MRKCAVVFSDQPQRSRKIASGDGSLHRIEGGHFCGQRGSVAGCDWLLLRSGGRRCLRLLSR